MTFYQWLYETMTMDKGHARIGQHLWNNLSSVKFNLVNHICESEELGKLDPFYVDSRIPAFLEYVKENWDKY